jgi:hypothetical protein
MPMEADGHHPQTDTLRWLTRALWALALAGLAYLAGMTVWLGVRGLFFPYQLDYGEGVLLHFVREWTQGRPIYRAIGEYPLITSNYPPLPIVLSMVLTPVLGLTYATGRIWTLLATVAICAILVAWVQQESRRWLPAIVAALAFAGSPYVYHWAPLFRVDLIGLALTLGGLYAVWRFAPPKVSPLRTGRTQTRRNRWLLWATALLFVAALYAKQSFFFAPAAAVIYLFLFVDRWDAVRLAGIVGLLGGGVFLLVNSLTAGGFWEGLVVSNVNPFLWDQFAEQVGSFFWTFAILGLLTGWYVVDKFMLDRATSLRDKVSPLDLYLLAALASLGFAGKAGAWENYFFEALAVLSLCSGLGLARSGRSGKWPLELVAPVLVLAQVGLMWHTPRVANRYFRLTHDSNEAMIPILARTPDPILSEDMGLLVTNGKVLDYYSFQYSQLARAGRWDQAWELDQLRDGRRPLVILEGGTRLDVDRYQRFTREFLSELDRSYRHARTVGKYELYEPDPLQHERRVEFGEQLALAGWSLHAAPDLMPGGTITLTAVWQAQQAPAQTYTAFAHLVDRDGQGWAGDDHQPYDGLYPTSAWGAGEMVRDIFVMTVPAGAPPGLYRVEVGWYDPRTQVRLPVGEGSSFRVAVLPVSWEGSGLQATTPLGISFGKVISLEGFAWQLHPAALEVTLGWSAGAYLDRDYTVFLHLVAPGGEGEVVAQSDGPPMDGEWPTSLWLPGMTLDDTHTIQIPPELPPGTYHLLAGLYDPATSERLTLPDGSDSLLLTEITLP